MTTSRLVDGRQQMMLRRFFWYAGSKHGVAKMYPEPLYDTIIEPFAGSAGYSTRWNNRNITLYDDSEYIAIVWDYLIHSSFNDLMSLPPFVKPSQLLSEQPLSQGARYLIGFWLVTLATVPLDRCPRTAWFGYGSGGSLLSVWREDIRHLIASQVGYISHWQSYQEDYLSIPNQEATWFIDPPYQGNQVSERYKGRGVDYNVLAEWCRSRKGQVIVCEGPDASWLPFQYLTTATKGGNKNKLGEYVWIQENP